jgi:hypothetical protein
MPAHSSGWVKIITTMSRISKSSWFSCHMSSGFPRYDKAVRQAEPADTTPLCSWYKMSDAKSIPEIAFQLVLMLQTLATTMFRYHRYLLEVGFTRHPPECTMDKWRSPGRFNPAVWRTRSGVCITTKCFALKCFVFTLYIDLHNT